MSLRDRVTFPRFAAFTTGLTLTLVMLGVYTAATGSGLACSAQWPLCDNGLLPQTIPSFIEWFHRLVAMVTGWFIIGTAVWAWRRPETGTRLTATLAALLLPLQISIGAVTVTLNGMLPDGYSPPTQGAHLVVALTIFSLLVWTALSAREETGPTLERVRRALLVALGALVVTVLASRVFTPTPYGPAGQAVFYGAALLTVAALLAATRWLADSAVSRLRIATGTALTLLFVGMLLGRDLVFYTSTVRLVNAAAFLLAGAIVAAVAVLTRRARADGRVGSTVS
ncbi:COX15/CtaA family protein [Haloplanus aerogenes]|uniref:Cytochrome c oxidase assembly protein subunit 15 n=1 Tax=Haloplanus aerogenes TaxID=660522 RepID=A0A3M0D9I4_9EURY|nr:COX15/CtaA family protein [Haloplanus aerogenes]AZH26495.1 cytochrome oxidase assembly protein [Haloplanus aerogenes]RMB18035.1 cytochrome c oxidase assembly protein subunit 15 [Haloplanus aerogenes]